MKHTTDTYEQARRFYDGSSCDCYRLLGCHPAGGGMHSFTVWAPNADSVALVGDFNNWDMSATPMERSPQGLFTCQVGGLENGAIYKYAVSRGGRTVLKADPFAFHSETGPRTGSRVWDLEGYEWSDADFLRRRRTRKPRSSAMSIYEVHIGSWRRKETEVFPWYRVVADELAEYCTAMHYTHVELLPVTEYPFEGSWGYQVTGYFCPTSRYGTPQDFMYFVDRLHRSGIGVIMDWVPAHFPRDEHGLAYFDGTPQFERYDPVMASHPQWGTLIFDYSRFEVRSFLMSSACFFADVYHIDGLRFDAVSSMLYLNYCRDGWYQPNEHGGNVDLHAVSLLREINAALDRRGCISIAEESSDFYGVTRPPQEGGLGFTFKWDMGFMHDTLDYFALDPVYRRYHHDKLTFSMMYAFNEHYILAFSHDEVVHGKKSMVDKMSGTYEEKFAALRALYGYQFAHPGKKLTFMGSEFGQIIEWAYKRELDWFLLKYPIHDSMHEYTRELNAFYLAHPSMYRSDDSWAGFRWLNVDDNERSCIAFMRASPRTRAVVCVCNFTPVAYPDFLIGMDRPGTLKLALNSDEPRFAGGGAPVHTEIPAVKNGFYGYSHSAQVSLPPMCCLYYEFIPSGNGGKNK